MNLRVFDTTDELIKAAARTLMQRIEAGARTIALSGGNTPKPLYELLGREKLPDITWVVVDERYVPIDDPQSNAGMIQKTLKPAKLLRFKTELGDPQKTAGEFEHEWRSLNIARLDVALLGMGDDGHTASLFPGTDVLAIEDRIAAAVFVPRMNQWRVTLTKPVLRAAQLRMVLAAGASKRPILQQVSAGAEYPIALVTSGVDTWWFVDREAAGDSLTTERTKGTENKP
ncbi:MAG TPA: 6-phosphogluconolactonase [Thermoanaerobaculia bacterium]|nr:6-phosphogluconolactonase [Thermoanaerobaculia bacterium]